MGKVGVSFDGSLSQILVNFSCFEPVIDFAPKIKKKPLRYYSVKKLRVFRLEQWFSTCDRSQPFCDLTNLFLESFLFIRKHRYFTLQFITAAKSHLGSSNENSFLVEVTTT